LIFLQLFSFVIYKLLLLCNTLNKTTDNTLHGFTSKEVTMCDVFDGCDVCDGFFGWDWGCLFDVRIIGEKLAAMGR